ncbi:hypothetical protein HK102_003651 [Quaeritorhiza haematococci]|nr:hypothetical protein HK102_003651 [Quaeritorhiza haematococci]
MKPRADMGHGNRSSAPNATSTSEHDKDTGADDASENLVLRFALGSRLFLCSLAIVSAWFCEDYDSSASLYLSSPSTLIASAVSEGTEGSAFVAKSKIEEFLAKAFLVFVKWDSLYFMHISESGYVWEQEQAFFPGLPMSIRYISIFEKPFLTFDQFIILCKVSSATKPRT